MSDPEITPSQPEGGAGENPDDGRPRGDDLPLPEEFAADGRPSRPIPHQAPRPSRRRPTRMSDRTDRPHDQAGEIVNPEDLPPQVEVTERDGVTRIDIADDATTRPGEPDPPGEST